VWSNPRAPADPRVDAFLHSAVDATATAPAHPIRDGARPVSAGGVAVTEPLRVLVLDDETMLLRLFGRVLGATPRDGGDAGARPTAALGPLSLSGPSDAELAGAEAPGAPGAPRFEVTTCVQAEQAIAAVRVAMEEGRPFGVAFVDVELPPGMNGIWAAERIRRLDPDLEIVITTAHGAVSVEELAVRVPPMHQLSYFRKPMHVAEILNATLSLGARWRRAAEERRRRRALESRVAALEAAPQAAPAEAAEAAGAGSGPASARHSAATVVMVVEDEPVVRRLATRILARRGYHVLEAEDGAAALRMADESPQPIELVLTDVVMPDMNGRHLASALRHRFPAVQLVFMSGYTNDELSAEALPKGARFLQKPFASGDLAEVVRASLAGEPG
jgi:CheY-like chemotaxis protein